MLLTTQSLHLVQSAKCPTLRLHVDLCYTPKVTILLINAPYDLHILRWKPCHYYKHTPTPALYTKIPCFTSAYTRTAPNPSTISPHTDCKSNTPPMALERIKPRCYLHETPPPMTATTPYKTLISKRVHPPHQQTTLRLTHASNLTEPAQRPLNKSQHFGTFFSPSPP